MSIDWTNFTPWTSLSGGLLIGLSAALFILFFGRVLGISGIVGGLLRPGAGDFGWRVAFILGIFAAPWLWLLLADPVNIAIEANTPTLIIAGLLVGLGTRFGSGCTSGHGVCGLSRLSPRSLVATLSFMAAGFITVYIVRHVVG
ncbi:MULTISPECIES: YeeE/YedE family protein [unclassified Pusillimonas]|uniref:YeeE/YedE family protein n=1 Tax=unclassified Pusillimonas TaxID=2640016 RepID=UPI000B9CCCE0|nr:MULTISPECIES: YeeE/YedE family protein [unclassified Pusillimonas]OXR50051.1 YeeE/YedE [Pusillimonas sp. T2]ROT46566.1 YeeE/YedE [Pusillimonas sp. NJUB218]